MKLASQIIPGTGQKFTCSFNLQEVLSGALMYLTNDNALFKLTKVIKFHFSVWLWKNAIALMD